MALEFAERSEWIRMNARNEADCAAQRLYWFWFLVLERIAAASFFCRDDQIHDPYIHARTRVRAPPRPQATCGLFRSVVDTGMPRYERATELKPRIFPKKQNEMKLFSMIFPSRKIFCQSTKNWLRKGSVTSLCNTFFETRCGNQTF